MFLVTRKQHSALFVAIILALFSLALALPTGPRVIDGDFKTEGGELHARATPAPPTGPKIKFTPAPPPIVPKTGSAQRGVLPTSPAFKKSLPGGPVISQEAIDGFELIKNHVLSSSDFKAGKGGMHMTSQLLKAIQPIENESHRNPTTHLSFFTLPPTTNKPKCVKTTWDDPPYDNNSVTKLCQTAHQLTMDALNKKILANTDVASWALPSIGDATKLICVQYAPLGTCRPDGINFVVNPDTRPFDRCSSTGNTVVGAAPAAPPAAVAAASGNLPVC